MTKQPFRFTLFLLICVLIPLTATAQTVNIPDSNLRAVIEKALGKASGASITTADMANLTELIAQNANINDLTGLEAATKLTRLDLGAEYVEAERRYINSNSISDFSPLSGLTNLTYLVLRNNNISDLSPLSSLTQLTSPGASEQQYLRLLTFGRFNQPDTAVSWWQQYFGSLTAFGINSTGIPVSWWQQYFGSLTGGGINSTDRTVS